MDLRTLDPGHRDELMALDAAIWGYKPSPAVAEAYGALFEWPRTVGAFDEGGRLVGSAAAYSLRLTLPGGGSVPLAGVTWVGVHATHRRRGLLRSMMGRMLDDAVARDEPVAGLFASESAIYRRFGYGAATRHGTWTITAAHARMRVAGEAWGTLERVAASDRDGVVGEVYDAVVPLRPGMTTRPPAGHHAVHSEADDEDAGFAPLQATAHRDPEGRLDGVVTYRLREHWDDELPDYTLKVAELLATSPRAELALWQHILGHDLVSRIEVPNRPLDEPVAELLVDPRRLALRAVHDGLHLRPLDLPVLLGARRYLREDSVVLEVVDTDGRLQPARVRVTGGLDAAACTATGDAADLVLDAAALGSALLGGTPLERLSRAGLVEERTPGMLRRATAMLLWAPSPWAGWIF